MRRRLSSSGTPPHPTSLPRTSEGKYPGNPPNTGWKCRATRISERPVTCMQSKGSKMTRVMTVVTVALALIGSGSLASAQESAAEAQNKQIVLEFYEKALNGKNPEAATSYFGSHYTQHNTG